MSDVLPQHDLDERKRLGREIGLENAERLRNANHDASEPKRLIPKAPGPLEWGNLTRSEVAYTIAKQMKAEGYDLSGSEWISVARQRWPGSMRGW